MPDRSFDRPTGDDDEVWFLRRDDLVARLLAAPRASHELLKFAAALATLVDPADIQSAFEWLERRGDATNS